MIRHITEDIESFSSDCDKSNEEKMKIVHFDYVFLEKHLYAQNIGYLPLKREVRSQRISFVFLKIYNKIYNEINLNKLQIYNSTLQCFVNLLQSNNYSAGFDQL